MKVVVIFVKKRGITWETISSKTYYLGIQMQRGRLSLCWFSVSFFCLFQRRNKDAGSWQPTCQGIWKLRLKQLWILKAAYGVCRQIIFTSKTLLSHLENRDRICFTCISHLCLSNKRLDYAEQHVSVLWEEPEWGWMAAEIHLFTHSFGGGITECLDTWILIC